VVRRRVSDGASLKSRESWVGVFNSVLALTTSFEEKMKR